MSSGTPTADLATLVAAREWYHTLELGPGVETPGWFDLRGIVSKMPFPDSLAGKRCLDVGTFDGFWAFELERRGAAEVVAIDVLDPRGWDWPAASNTETIAAIGRRKQAGDGFELAREALGSRVARRELSVYELDPAEVGEFDLVYVGSLLLHLRDPVGALIRVRSVCTETLIVCDGVLGGRLGRRRRPLATLDGRGRPWWWKPNVAGLVRMVEAAGFEPLGGPVRLRMPAGAGHPASGLRPGALLRRELREAMLRARFGDPHAALAARPA